jgi:hypothetical protein
MFIDFVDQFLLAPGSNFYSIFIHFFLKMVKEHTLYDLKLYIYWDLKYDIWASTIMYCVHIEKNVYSAILG